MHTRTNLIMTSLAGLWMATGLFGGLTFLAAPTHQDAQPLKAYSTPPWVHAGRVSPAAGAIANAASPRI
jgi:hypothetical protein